MVRRAAILQCRITDFITVMRCVLVCTVLVYCYVFTECTITRNLSAGLEHHLKGPNAPPPSYCTLHMFHAPLSPDLPVSGLGYISRDGHLFDCKSPAEMQKAFHV